jgi:hypothetical protein
MTTSESITSEAVEAEPERFSRDPDCSGRR